MNKSPLAATKAVLFSVAEGSPSVRARVASALNRSRTSELKIVAIGKTSPALFRSTLERILAEAKSMGEVRATLFCQGVATVQS